MNPVYRPYSGDIIIGQEAICPDGLGRVINYDLKQSVVNGVGSVVYGVKYCGWVQVSTYVDDRQCKWDIRNVQLIDPRR